METEHHLLLMAATVKLNPPPKVALECSYATKILVWPNRMRKEFIIAGRLNHNYDRNGDNKFGG